MTTYEHGVTRQKPLQGMFTVIPRHYDLVNLVINWGLDRHWRRLAAKECLTTQPKKVLDLCCGTGDLTINIARLDNSGAEIVGADYSEPMLDIARQKAKLLASDKNISFKLSDATDLPFPDRYFDCVGISFAFRNLTYKNPNTQRHLSEISRVLCAGGTCVIVESSQPGNGLTRWLFHLYLRWFVASVGRWLSGNKGAYQYLAESAARFYTPDKIKDILHTAGFSQINFRPLFLGAVGIHVAIK
jgi:demethylmenaquinone methyltransferase/2-methoxy-6-polyprenyl-1,4-benzoquinol methylase